MCLAAIEAGKHVFCEWPVAVNAIEMEEMAVAAGRKGVKAMAGLQARAAPSLQHLKNLIADGFIGRPLTANARFSLTHPFLRQGLPWTLERSNGNHVLSIYGGHMLDIIAWTLGGLKEASATISTGVKQWPDPETFRPIDANAPDCVIVQAKSESGVILSAHFAYVPALATGWRFEVFGDKGTVVASSRGPAMGLPNFLEGAQVGDRELKELAVPDSLVTIAADYPRDSSFHVAQMYKRLAEAIESDSSFEPDFNSALRLHRLLATLEQSDSQEGAWLPVT
jgi:predicted dehydrogenase